MTDAEKFDAALAKVYELQAERGALHGDFRTGTHPILVEYRAAIYAAARALPEPKKRKGKTIQPLDETPEGWSECFKRLSGGQESALAVATEKGEALDKELREKLKTLEEELCSLAPLVPVPVVTAETLWHEVALVYGGSYGSTCNGDTYARALAEMQAEDLVALGYQAKVQAEYTSGRDSGNFAIVVQGDSPDVAEVARRLPARSLKEWVRGCWGKGVNPRVYNPYLPHGYEDRNGLNYFGGYTSSAAPSR